MDKSVRVVGGEDGADARAISAALPLRGDGSCIAEARRFAVDFLVGGRTERDLAVSARAMDVTQLVVSELVTNARLHAPGPALLELRIANAMLEVTVRDSLSARPVTHRADPERIGRHGLEIVQAVTQDLRVRPEPSGKRVTARIALVGASDDSPGRTTAAPSTNLR